MSARALAAAVAAGRQRAVDAAEASFVQADTVNAGRDGLNIFLAADRRWSLAAAEAVDARCASQRVAGDAPSLAGVAVAIKDNIATHHLPTTCGSRILEGYVSPYEATAVSRLHAAGAVVVGKTNLDEFGMGSSTEFSAFGPTRNPRDRSRVPGGSSGGSAAAVAAGIVRIALGSETGGSVRQPAAFCGVVGVKPTYGRVSRYGLVAYASSLDQIGVFGATVDDAALGLGAIAGFDRRDATSRDVAVPDYGSARRGSLRGVVVGRPREYFGDGLDPRIADRCAASFERLRALGAEVREVSLPHTALAIPTYYVLAPAEASANLARYDGVRYGVRAPADDLETLYAATRARGFGREVRRRILLGTYVLSAGYRDAYYARATAARAKIREDFTRAFASGIHVLFTPTTPTVAFPFGAKSDPYEMYLSDVYTVTANLAGIPALSLPIGEVDGLPVGGQLLAAPFDEPTLFGVASALESAYEGGARNGRP